MTNFDDHNRTLASGFLIFGIWLVLALAGEVIYLVAAVRVADWPAWASLTGLFVVTPIVGLGAYLLSGLVAGVIDRRLTR